MKLDDFMVDYYPQGYEVLVEASELQKMMRMFNDYEKIIEQQQQTIDTQKLCIDFVKSQLDDFRNGKMKVDLRG